MNMWGHYEVNPQSIRDTLRGDHRLEVSAHMDLDMFCSLPIGTEVVCMDIAPLGMGVSMTTIIISDDERDSVRRWAAETGATHMPHSVLVYLLPDQITGMDDLSSVLNQGFIALGKRHGQESAPMFSESLLRERYSDTWNDDAYNEYVKAYKIGAQHRKGN